MVVKQEKHDRRPALSLAKERCLAAGSLLSSN